MRFPLPAGLHRFFWEYDSDQLDIHEHADVIMARLMDRGFWSAMQWLAKTYSSESIKSFLLRKGWRFLAPREVNYWALLSGMLRDQKKQLVQKAREGKTLWSKRSAP